jgi:hypothetical protein
MRLLRTSSFATYCRRPDPVRAQLSARDRVLYVVPPSALARPTGSFGRQQWRRRQSDCPTTNHRRPKRARIMLEAATRQDLAVHQAMSTVLRALRSQVGVGERDISRLTQAQGRTVRRWLEGTAVPHPDSADRIDELRAIVMVLGDMLDPDGIVAWLRNRNPTLEFRRPLEVLSTSGGFDEVLSAAQALVSGTYV